jgi:hypothetical protein
MLDRALKRYTTEQDMIDKVSAWPIFKAILRYGKS